MKQPRVIQRLSSFTLAILLLFTAVWGPGGLAREQALHTKKVAKEQTRQDKAADSHEAQLSAAGYEAVVTPAVTFGGGAQTAFLLPAPTLFILLLLSVPLLKQFSIPHYFFSYFRHVFGHAIAPNAP